ncbi:Esterase/lipase [Marinobacter mobilis]|uniref:Esterase/lipase n=1 Tax=Marinobacter mobilis TaxID=488533 RepID=A0A1H3DS64_9GAMM|nr:Esterase/lipase [Marinobacter mobilis]
MAIGLQAFQLAFATYSRLLPTRAAGTATRLMTTPRVPEALRKRSVSLGEELVNLGGGSYLSVRQGGPQRVLLVHGWSSGVGLFEPLVKALPAADYTLYAVHPPGHGPSAQGASHPGRFIEAIEAALDYIDAPIDLAVGHSMGAGTLAYVVSNDSCVQRLALVSGPATFEGLLRGFSRFMKLSPRAERRFLRQMEETVGLPLTALDITARARQIQVPTLVIHDRKDREVPFTCAEQLVTSLPVSEHIYTSGLGHNRILRDSAVIARLAAFAGNCVDSSSWPREEGEYATASS